VVDDLGLSFESTHFVRSALKKFVDEQMQTGDLVAIIRTGGGMERCSNSPWTSASYTPRLSELSGTQLAAAESVHLRRFSRPHPETTAPMSTNRTRS